MGLRGCREIPSTLTYINPATPLQGKTKMEWTKEEIEYLIAIAYFATGDSRFRLTLNRTFKIDYELQDKLNDKIGELIETDDDGPLESFITLLSRFLHK
jgi:hypothetical protein